MSLLPEKVHYFESSQAPKEEREEIQLKLKLLEKYTHVSYHNTRSISEILYKEDGEMFSHQGRSGILNGLKALLLRVESTEKIH